MEAVTAPNQSQGDEVVCNKFLEVLAGLFQSKQKYNHLLRPVARLQQVVGLEDGFVRLVRETLIHGLRVEVPNRRPAHDIQAEGPVDGEVHGGVKLFHKSGLLGARLDAAADRNRPDEALHKELAGEREDNGIEGHEGEVASTFAILDGCGGVRAWFSWKWVGEEQGRGYGVLRRGVDEIERQYDENQVKRQDPSMSHAGTLIFGEGAPYRTALRAAARLLALRHVSTAGPR